MRPTLEPPARRWYRASDAALFLGVSTKSVLRWTATGFVRCERAGDERFCGLRLSGVKFHRRMDRAAFEHEVDTLVAGAFASDPHIVEVDLWTTVPLDAGKGAIVSGDFAQPTSATVYATTARRRDASPSRGPNVFWDPTFRRELERGSSG